MNSIIFLISLSSSFTSTNVEFFKFAKIQVRSRITCDINHGTDIVKKEPTNFSTLSNSSFASQCL